MASMADLQVQADKKRLADLHKKHVAGKISTTEYREYKALARAEEEREKEEAQRADPGAGAWFVGNRDLAELLGVSQKTICAWAKLGMPRTGRDQYDFRQVFPWWLENINKGPEDKDETITEAKRRYWVGKSEQIEIKNAALRGEYVRQDEVMSSASGHVAIFRNAVRSWRTRLPPLLVGKTQDEMLPLIETEMDAALAALSRSLVESTKEKKPCRKKSKKRRATSSTSRSKS